MVDLSGIRYGRLTVVERSGSRNKRRLWKCVCDCGSIVFVNTDSLKSGNTRSCGCLQAEMRIKSNTIHGESKTRLYRIWKGMVARCRNIGSTDYKWYGAKGVTVCNDWRTYSSFAKWARGNGYSKELTLDRINPYGDYTPDNCRWATIAEQNMNRRKPRNDN